MSADGQEQESHYRRLSIEELRKFPGCEEYSNEEANEIIDTLEEFSIMLFRLFQENQNK